MPLSRDVNPPDPSPNSATWAQVRPRRMRTTQCPRTLRTKPGQALSCGTQHRWYQKISKTLHNFWVQIWSLRMASSDINNMLLTVITGWWVPLDLERAMCAICHSLLFVFSPGLKIIDTLTDQRGKRAGSRLESCTTEVRAVRLFNNPVYGDRIVLVDTPGFDDTNKSDLEILQMVGDWLRKV